MGSGMKAGGALPDGLMLEGTGYANPTLDDGSRAGPVDEPTDQRRIAEQLVRAGKGVYAVELCQSELLGHSDGDAWLNELTVAAMEQRDLTAAGELAGLLAAFRWGSRWFPPRANDGSILPPPKRVPRAKLSVPKLRHDIEQFRYLRNRGILGSEFDSVIADYERIALRLAPLGPNARVPMRQEDERRIGPVFNRIIHIGEAPRLKRALSPTWDPADIEKRYLHSGFGLVVIDDFLTERAVKSLQRFCLESTVWSGDRYADGRLGALMFSGFNCPLLLQIAEEVRNAFPHVVARHPLRQLWGFKNPPRLPADSTVHADFAAVNVNFWITPELANLDPGTGGLVVYDVAAPMSWNFDAYNQRTNLIRNYLRERGACALRIPYRQNRAIIFNSDLFHATSEIRFRAGYENRRVNITMLYGDRENDDRHPATSAVAPERVMYATSSAWRSNAFRARRR